MLIHTIINSVLRSCTYIIYWEKREAAYLIDCGDASTIIAFLESQNKKLRGIFLTHCHYDHIYGLNEVTNKYPEVMIYGSRVTLDSLSDIKLNLSKYNGAIYTYNRTDNVKEISNVLMFQEENLIIEPIPSSGHDLGCLSYLVNNNLFTGDAYIPGLPVVAGWPRSNKSKAKETELYLRSLVETNNYKLYPGHIVND